VAGDDEITHPRVGDNDDPVVIATQLIEHARQALILEYDAAFAPGENLRRVTPGNSGESFRGGRHHLTGIEFDMVARIGQPADLDAAALKNNGVLITFSPDGKGRSLHFGFPIMTRNAER